MECEDKIRKELSCACQRAYARGIQTGNGGNVSARIKKGTCMIVKSSGGSFADADEDSFVLTDFDGKVLEKGNKRPTREVLLHGYLYKLFPQVLAVVHTHSPYAVAWSHNHDLLPRVTWQARLKISDDIPVIRIPSAAVGQEHLYMVEEALAAKRGVSCFILADHGVVAMAKSPIEAEHMAEFVEEIAQIAFFEDLAGRP